MKKKTKVIVWDTDSELKKKKAIVRVVVNGFLKQFAFVHKECKRSQNSLKVAERRFVCC